MSKIRKGFWLEPTQAKMVETLASKLNVSESQVIRMMQDTYTQKLWLTLLKNK